MRELRCRGRLEIQIFRCLWCRAHFLSLCLHWAKSQGTTVQVPHLPTVFTTLTEPLALSPLRGRGLGWSQTLTRTLLLLQLTSHQRHTRGIRVLDLLVASFATNCPPKEEPSDKAGSPNTNWTEAKVEASGSLPKYRP